MAVPARIDQCNTTPSAGLPAKVLLEMQRVGSREEVEAATLRRQIGHFQIRRPHC
jgi:hypothetical protein